MKLYIINPDYGEKREDMDARCEILQRHVGPDVTTSMDCLTETKVEIDSAADALLAGPEILAMAERAEKNGADAVILYCFSDPAIEACRERLTIPVIGGAEASLLLSPLSMRRAGILLADKSRVNEKILFTRTRGLDPARIAMVDAIDFHGKSIWDDREGALSALIEKGNEMKAKGVDGLILGCLSFLGLAAPLAKALGIPVIDPAIAAVTMAEAMVRMEIKN